MIQIKFRHTFERIKSQLSPAQLPLVVFRGINEHTHKQIERAKRSRGQTETQKLIKKNAGSWSCSGCDVTGGFTQLLTSM